jgi:hypothetical protein
MKNIALLSSSVGKLKEENKDLKKNNKNRDNFLRKDIVDMVI